jgi:UDP-N-acetylmuramate--alanine ligase
MENAEFKSIYFIGIKGTAMSALALIAQTLGYEVRGSDTNETFITDASLLAAGIKPLVGFEIEHLNPTPDLVVVGAAFGENNPEVAAARAKNIPVWTSSELQGYLTRQKKTLAVAGTHGKTTTTSILAFLLFGAQLDPSFIIGTGEVAGLPAHGVSGKGEYFVLEADDYKRATDDPRPKFLDLSPYAAIITSIEHDHPDMYPTLEDCLRAFCQFTEKVASDGFLIVNGDDAQLMKLRQALPQKRYLTVGFSPTNQNRLVIESDPTDGTTEFRLERNGQSIGSFKLALKGRHNVFNAGAAILVALEIGVSLADIQRLLPTFQSVERRYQLVGNVGDQIVIDDYAHHPTAVRLTLQTAKKQYPDKAIWCLFQSHTYSRTKALLAEFGEAFTDADTVIITDIFASARETEKVIDTSELVAEVKKHHTSVYYVAKNELLAYIKRNLPPNAVLITMGAGDIYKIGRQYVGKSS